MFIGNHFGVFHVVLYQNHFCVGYRLICSGVGSIHCADNHLAERLCTICGSIQQDQCYVVPTLLAVSYIQVSVFWLRAYDRNLD